VLPATPATNSPFPAYVRLTRGGYNEAAVLTGGVAFAKPKRNIFKGPISSRSKRDSTGSATSSIGRKRGGGGIIEEEEEEEDVGLGIGIGDLDDDVEEVLEFGPVLGGEEVVIIDDDDYEGDSGSDGERSTIREQKRPATSG
jgi:hypothetical protein